MKVDDDIRTVLSQMRLVHEIQTSNLIDQALSLFKLEASLLEKGTTDDNNWGRPREKRRVGIDGWGPNYSPPNA